MNPTLSAAQTLAVFADPEASVAELLCDRHDPDAVAFVLVDTDGAVRDLTYGQLRQRSEAVAGVLASLGVSQGDRVATLMGKGADLVSVILGAWRLGAAYVPLFTAFSTGAVTLRLAGSRARVVVVDPGQRSKVDSKELPGCRVIVTGEADPGGDEPTLGALIDAAPPYTCPPVRIGGSGALVHMFTSGTTGKPKGVVHPLTYAAGWQVYLEYALGVTKISRYWSAADPGWAYGLYTAIVAPLAAGIPSLLAAGNFSGPSTWAILASQGITDFAAAPTVYRALAAQAGPIPDGVCLARASSAGEPLTPDVNIWAEPNLGVTVHDHFGQTEVGMVLANHHHDDLSAPVKAGSMGRSVPGWQMTVLAAQSAELAPAGEFGRLAVDVANSRLMTFQDYADASAAAKFTPDRRFYLTGDSARIDPDGDFFFSARADDVIIMAGYRIGPFEIESVLSEHPAVVECAVIAAPDQVRGEVIEAYVVARRVDGTGDAGLAPAARDTLAKELQDHVKTRYAAYAYPRAIHFVDQLPKTPSGKVKRYELRARRRDELQRTAGTIA
jgi:acetyl-CoA synthetase